MTSDDAARLVNLLVATWPTGPKAYVWTQTIGDLDAAPANRAYAELRDNVERVTVAAFLTRYRAQLRVTTAPRRRDPDPGCEWCRGCGYEDGPPEYETIGGEPHAYTTLVPCRCTQPRAASRAPAHPSLLEEFWWP
jgi:hypothetical protein